MKKNDIQEIEFKWGVRSKKDIRRFLEETKDFGAKIGPPKNLQIIDHYLDTPNHLFGLTRTSCRLRNQSGHWELNVKASSRLKGGLAMRREKTYSLPSLPSFLKALAYCQNKILNHMLGAHHLQKLFEIRNRRVVRKLILDGTEAELCMDDVSIQREGYPVTALQEIELEFLKGDLDVFLKFAQKISLKPADISKVATARKAFSLETPLPTPGIYSFSKDDSLAHVVSQTIKQHDEILKMNEASFRVGMNDEAVHDLRVTLRYIRAVLEASKTMLFEGSLQKMTKDLAWLRDQFALLRDLQVHLKSLKEEIFSEKSLKPFNAYQAFLQEKIDKEYDRGRDLLNSNRYAALKNALSMLSFSRKGLPSKNASKVGKKALKKMNDKLSKFAAKIHSDDMDKKLHALRILIRNLRYVCEVFQPVLDEDIHKFIKKTIHLQTLLGQFQDVMIQIHLIKTHQSASDLPRYFSKDIRSLLRTKLREKNNEKRKLGKAAFKEWRKYQKKALPVLEKVLG